MVECRASNQSREFFNEWTSASIRRGPARRGVGAVERHVQGRQHRRQRFRTRGNYIQWSTADGWIAHAAKHAVQKQSRQRKLLGAGDNAEHAQLRIGQQSRSSANCRRCQRRGTWLNGYPENYIRTNPQFASAMMVASV